MKIGSHRRQFDAKAVVEVPKPPEPVCDDPRAIVVVFGNGYFAISAEGVVWTDSNSIDAVRSIYAIDRSDARPLFLSGSDGVVVSAFAKHWEVLPRDLDRLIAREHPF